MQTTINQRVKELREYLNLTQEEFAVRIGSTNASVSRIEKGLTEPRKSTINKIVSTFNVNEWLINGKGSLEIVKPSQPQMIWKDEAYEAVKSENSTLKQEVERLWTLVINFSQKGTNPNFLKALDVAKIPLYLINKGIYSGANAAC